MQPHVEHAGKVAADGFLPHGYCYLWDTPLVVTHVVSDLLIGIAYVAISVALAWLVHRARRDIPFSAIFVAFGLFIVTCGFTHFIEVWTLWNPVYWLAGAVKGVTAAASVTTAIAMPFTVPRVLTTIRDARLSRERELAAARADALAEQNARLEVQARELEAQRAAAAALAVELEATNARLREALALADAERQRAEEAAWEAEEARATAEEANRAKSAFLATMSHELRTPLNAIGGYVDLLDMELRGPVTADQRTDLQRVRGAQRHLLRIINDILEYARIEAGQVQYRHAPVTLAEVVEQAVALVAPQLTAKGQALEVDVPPAAVARADRDKVLQVLLNLLSNAHKYSRPGDHIAVLGEASDGVVRLRVRDTGPGVAPEKRDRIFEPFVQAVGGLTRPHEGTGLGLAISRDLARGMGGDVTLVDRPDGAEFVLALPAGRVD